jgi:hypothetical protein
MWVILKQVRGEFLGMADQIAACLGKVVGSDILLGSKVLRCIHIRERVSLPALGDQ